MSMLSDQNNHSLLGMFGMPLMLSASHNSTTAAINSRQGILIAWRGATLDFKATSLHVTVPSSYKCLVYVAVLCASCNAFRDSKTGEPRQFFGPLLSLLDQAFFHQVIPVSFTLPHFLQYYFEWHRVLRTQGGHKEWQSFAEMHV